MGRWWRRIKQVCVTSNLARSNPRRLGSLFFASPIVVLFPGGCLMFGTNHLYIALTYNYLRDFLSCSPVPVLIFLRRPALSPGLMELSPNNQLDIGILLSCPDFLQDEMSEGCFRIPPFKHHENNKK